METVRTGVNLEMAAAGDILDIACELCPMQATLVPERREEITTEGGLDLSSAERRAPVAAALERLREVGVRTSLFIDPDEETLTASAMLGADAVELHTGQYANASGSGARIQLERLEAAAERGRELGLAVHAGHGLTYENVTPVAAIDLVEELNIGHSVISRAVLVGMERAVAEMATILRRARRT
jgi:pyridoxine 5-phosphate synthase